MTGRLAGWRERRYGERKIGRVKRAKVWGGTEEREGKSPSLPPSTMERCRGWGG